MEFRNRMALVSWVGSALFLAGVAAATYVGLRDGSPSEWFPTVLVVFWAGALGFAAYASQQVVATVRILSDKSVEVRERKPFSSSSRTVARSEIESVAVFERVDDEDNPYFSARLQLADGSSVDFAECHDRAKAEAAVESFRVALR